MDQGASPMMCQKRTQNKTQGAQRPQPYFAVAAQAASEMAIKSFFPDAERPQK